jgi:flagellar biosynthesis/type III secretory pathway chaperone
METKFVELYRTLQDLVGVYRQLLEVIRVENEALLQMDRKRLIEATFSKEALIFSAQQSETKRASIALALASTLGIKVDEKGPTLAKIIVALQGIDLKSADQLRSLFTTLTVLLQRIDEQNMQNRKLVDQGLHHLNRMRDQILGAPKTQGRTYSSSGKSVAQADPGARIVSREA